MKFKATAKNVEFSELVVEAGSLEEAEKKIYEADGGDFINKGKGYFEITGIEEVKK